jgi:lipopolysaccharide/colanic/teichoic acid biosynthesis glycosyltransferase
MALVLLFFLLPVMLLVAVLIKLTSPGPALFCQPRIGLNNRIFYCYKFRTMNHDRDDPRITRLGSWLRRVSFDELPQLWNVVKGDMSLVGPRPHLPSTKAGDVLFAEIAGNYAQRHGVPPGMTGWAQINGYRGETRNRQQLIQRLEFDLHYVRNWSIWFDLVILWRTVIFVIFDETVGGEFHTRKS